MVMYVCLPRVASVSIFNSIFTDTVSHEKCVTLFWTITSVFLDEFLHFLYQWKRE